MNRGCTRHPTLPVPLEPRHGGDTRFWGGVGKAVTPCSLVWLGRHWGGCECPCPCLCPPVEAASAGGWGHHFRGETGQVGDTISGVRQDRLGTPFQGCYGTGQTRHRFRDATGHDSLGSLFQGAVPMLQGGQGEAGLAAQRLGVLRGGVCPHTLPAPHLRLRGRTQLPARACIPGIWECGGGPAASVPSDPSDDTSPLLFLLSPPAGSA